MGRMGNSTANLDIPRSLALKTGLKMFAVASSALLIYAYTFIAGSAGALIAKTAFRK